MVPSVATGRMEAAGMPAGQASHGGRRTGSRLGRNTKPPASLPGALCCWFSAEAERQRVASRFGSFKPPDPSDPQRPPSFPAPSEAPKSGFPISPQRLGDPLLGLRTGPSRRNAVRSQYGILRALPGTRSRPRLRSILPCPDPTADRRLPPALSAGIPPHSLISVEAERHTRQSQLPAIPSESSDNDRGLMAR